jgi:hypothetical protein
MDSVMSACWFTMEHTFEINALPPWYVQMKDIDNDGIAEGVQRLPGDMNNSKTGDKWDGGATRAAWRIPFAYIAFGDPWALKWTQKMYDFYKSKQSDPTLLSAYRPSSGEQYYEGPSDLSIYGAGVIAMALGDHEWTDKVWDYMTDPARKSERNDQKKAQRLYCLLQMSGEFDVYGDAEFAPAVSVESKPHAQSLRSPEKIQGMIIGKNAIIPHHIRDYVKDHGAVAVYDLRGTLVGSADDHTSLVGLASGLSAGKYLLRPSAATLHR